EARAARRGWELVHHLVWCAAQAARRPDIDGDEIDLILEALSGDSQPGGLGNVHGLDPDQAWGWIHTFQGATPRKEPLPAPVALGEGEGQEGFLADLKLEVLEGGAGAASPPPAAAFQTRLDPDFRASMADAWGAVKAKAEGDGMGPFRHSGRYRVLRDGR